jgi:hypothetical protein
MARNYGLVPQSINSLADRIERQTERESRDKMALANLGLQKAQLGLQNRALGAEQNFNLAKQQREQWLSEPVTVGQAIDTHPNWDDATKNAVKMSIPDPQREGVLNHPTTRGKLNEFLGQLRQEKIASEQFNQKMGLEQQKLNLMRQKTAAEKDNRPNMQKEVEFIAQTMGTTPQEALKAYRQDKTLPERIRLYNNELDRLAKDFHFQDLDGKQKAEKVNKLRKDFGISDIMPNEGNNDSIVGGLLKRARGGQ